MISRSNPLTLNENSKDIITTDFNINENNVPQIIFDINGNIVLRYQDSPEKQPGN